MANRPLLFVAKNLRNASMELRD